MKQAICVVLALFFLSACTGGIKLLLDKDPEVYSRYSNQKCPRLWFVVHEDKLDEAFGGDCQVVIRRTKFLIFNPESSQWEIPQRR